MHIRILTQTHACIYSAAHTHAHTHTHTYIHTYINAGKQALELVLPPLYLSLSRARYVFYRHFTAVSVEPGMCFTATLPPSQSSQGCVCVCVHKADCVLVGRKIFEAKAKSRSSTFVQREKCNFQTAQNGVFDSVAIFAGQLKRNQLYEQTHSVLHAYIHIRIHACIYAYIHIYRLRASQKSSSPL
jgi:hypothetical protein